MNKLYNQIGERMFRFNKKQKEGDSMKFLGQKYKKGESIKLKIGDKVIIHPVPGHSQAGLTAL